MQITDPVVISTFTFHFFISDVPSGEKVEETTQDIGITAKVSDTEISGYPL